MTHYPELVDALASKQITGQKLKSLIYTDTEKDGRFSRLVSIVCSSQQINKLQSIGAVKVLAVELPDSFFSEYMVSNEELEKSMHAIFLLCDEFPDSCFFAGTSYDASNFCLEVFYVSPTKPDE